MFSGWRMTLMSTIMCFNWFASSLCYYGLTFNSTNLGSNAYASFALSMLVELPAMGLCHVLALKVGRRLPLLVSMIAGGVCLLLTLAFKPGMNWFYFIHYFVSQELVVLLAQYQCSVQSLTLFDSGSNHHHSKQTLPLTQKTLLLCCRLHSCHCICESGENRLHAGF